jgi:hypothetical protein
MYTIKRRHHITNIPPSPYAQHILDQNHEYGVIENAMDGGRALVNTVMNLRVP